MSLPARLSTLALACIAALWSLTAAGGEIPERPEDGLLDEGSVFTVGEAIEIWKNLRDRLDAGKRETGCDLAIATVLSIPETTIDRETQRYADAWLAADIPECLLFFDRSEGRIYLSATETAGELIPNYVLSGIAERISKADLTPSQKIEKAAGEVLALFRKNWGDEIGKNPAETADAILFAVVGAFVVLGVGLMAFLHSRGTAEATP
ncbi:MAG: hypothetical protein KDM91_00870 [Verrucomicrobiae bacterium]|nr:hypothetical protein [Verrucomicrobiae bacterium]